MGDSAKEYDTLTIKSPKSENVRTKASPCTRYTSLPSKSHSANESLFKSVHHFTQNVTAYNIFNGDKIKKEDIT